MIRLPSADAMCLFCFILNRTRGRHRPSPTPPGVFMMQSPNLSVTAKRSSRNPLQRLISDMGVHVQMTHDRLAAMHVIRRDPRHVFIVCLCVLEIVRERTQNPILCLNCFPSVEPESLL